MNVRTRMAPSPTGNLHIGTTYATMWPYLYARHNKGVFILRIEDTDQQRSTKEFEENIIQGLKNLGFDWDEKIYHQMDRLEIYRQYVDKLLVEDKAYYCFCSKEELDTERAKQVKSKSPQIYSGKCRHLSKEEVQNKLDEKRDYVIRFKMPADRGIIKFLDTTHGEIRFDSSLIGDMVIMRSNGIPLYNFAVVVDDIDMNITHVIRGDDHISNTPKQVVLFEAFNSSIPEYTHFPMILNQDRIGKLSKRTGSTSLDSFLKEGFLPEALFNYIFLLGYSLPENQEIISKEQIINHFDINNMSKSAAAWNQEKLEWLNGEYIRQLSDEALTERLRNYLVDHPNKNQIVSLVPLVKERIKTLSEFIPLTSFIFEEPEYEVTVFQSLGIVDIKQILEKISDNLENLGEVDEQTFEQSFRKLAEELQISAKQIFQLIRVAISGQSVTPPLYQSIKILGFEKAKMRIKLIASKYPNI